MLDTSTETPRPHASTPASAAGRVLIVDDDPTSRLYFQAALRKTGWEVVSAAGGQVAQSIMSTTRPFDCAVIDYRMPDMDGMQLLHWIRQKDAELATVIATAEGEKVLVERALAGGANGFLNKPVALDALYREVTRAAESTRSNRRLMKMARDVEQVGRTQKHILLLSADNHSTRIHVSHHPHHEAGGDFFVRFPVSDQETILIAGDVSGHDLDAAYQAAYFQGFARGMLRESASLEKILEAANQILIEEWSGQHQNNLSGETPKSISVSAFALNRQSNSITVFANGSPLPMLVDQEGRMQRMGQAGYPLGWFKGRATTPESYPLHKGSWLGMWSDGVDDLAAELCVDPLALIYALERNSLAKLKSSWLDLAKDDVLAVTIQLDPESLSPPPYPLMLGVYEKNQSGKIEEWQSSWRRTLQFALPGLSNESMFNILLTAREAVLNAVNHGCRPGQSASLQMTYFENLQQVRLIVSDPGQGHSYVTVADEAELRTAHRGLELIHTLACKVTKLRNGAELIVDLYVHFGDE